MDTTLGLEVVIHGAATPLGSALVEKLLTSTKTIFVAEKEFHLMDEKIAPTVSLHGCSIAIAVGDEDCRKIEFTEDEDFNESFDITISPNCIGSFRQTGTHVVIHDLLLPQRNENWAPSEIYDWVETLLLGGEPTLDSQPRHWLSHRDAATGIFDLLHCEKLSDGIIPMCGRKLWTPSETSVQLELLLQRSLSASEHSFSVSELAVDPEQVYSDVSSISKVGGPSHYRPDLEPLHSALLELKPEGWRTLTPLRVSLMEVIANYLEVAVD